MRPDGTTVAIAFGSYGNYEFAVTDAVLREFSGAAIVGGAPAPEHWRRMRCVRSLSPVESKMLGATGAGSQWSFEWAGGTFPVEFRGDGYNHFVCSQFPAHSHWSLGGAASDELTINWGTYGTYELKVDSSGLAVGSAQGKPDEWRRMAWLADLGAHGDIECADHDHSHEHHAGCGH